MATTILETLCNAEYNLAHGYPFQASLCREQLHNAIVLLKKGYSIYDEVETLIEKYGYGEVEDIPELKESLPKEKEK